MAVVQKKRGGAGQTATQTGGRGAAYAPPGSAAPGVTPLGTCKLPGLQGASKLYQAHDAYLRPFGLLSYSSPNQYTVVLESVAEAPGGVGPDQLEEWARQWDRSIGVLSGKSELAAAAVTLDAVLIEGGQTLEMTRQWWTESNGFDWIFGDADPAEMLAEVSRPPVRLRARIALTFSTAERVRQSRRNVEEMATEIGRRLPGLSAGLQMTENGPARPLTGAEIAEAVRVAYDPSIGGWLAQARHEGGSRIRWDQAGPIDSQEDWGHYRHDGAYSVTWTMSQSSGGGTFAAAIAQWLEPDPAVAEKRVTLLYRAPTPAAGDDGVDSDTSGGNGRRRARRAQAAPTPDTSNPWLNEPRLTRYGLLATATVTHRDDLRYASAVVNELPSRARVLMRRVYGSQASAFVTALPLGVVVPDRLSLPQGTRSVASRRKSRRA